VHDELLFEMKNDIIKDIVPVIKDAMEEQKLSDIPLVVSVSSGNNWADMEKFIT